MRGNKEAEFIKKQQNKDNIVCWECYSPEVTKVCHHCGRFLCDEHSYILKDDSEFSQKIFGGLLGKKKVPGLAHTAHCREHMHPRYKISPLFVFGGILLIIGILFLYFNLFIPKYNILSLLTGTSLLSIGGYAHYTLNIKPAKKHMIDRKNKGVVPLVPDIRVDAEEEIEGTYNINNNEEESYLDIDDSQGHLDIKCTLTEREERRHRKFKEIYESNLGNSPWDFGVMGYDNTESVDINKTERIKQNRIFLDYFPTSQNQIMDLCRKRRPINISTQYEITKEADKVGPKWDKEFPVWITPTIGKEGDENILTLTLNNTIPFFNLTNSPNRQIRIKKMIIDLPPELESADEIMVNDKISGKYDDRKNKIIWSDINLDPNRPIELQIKFRRPVKNTSEIKGKIELEFSNYLISGFSLKEDWIWTPSGFPQTSQGWDSRENYPKLSSFGGEGERIKDINKKTKVKADISLDTSVLSAEGQYTEKFEIEKKELVKNHLYSTLF